MKRFGSIVAVAAMASLGMVLPMGSATASAACPLPVFGPGNSYHPVVHPANFGPHVTNPWFPLIKGTTFVYAGVKDTKKALDIFSVSTHTRKIDGVVTRIVNDRLFLNGKLRERTSDYYAQDTCGNVWYFGEDTAELDANGNVTNTDGSFHAGVNGAQPGVFMQASPKLGRRFRQEWLTGQAEDRFRAISTSASVTVPFGTFHHALLTAERSALEPDVLDHKYYVKGIGEVVETSVTGAVETLRLVDVLR